MYVTGETSLQKGLNSHAIFLFFPLRFLFVILPPFGIRSAHLGIKNSKFGLCLPLCTWRKLLALRDHPVDGIGKQALLFFWPAFLWSRLALF
jgi:hypothetical protein